MKIILYDNYIKEEIQKFKTDKLVHKNLENYIKKINTDKHFDNKKLYKKKKNYCLIDFLIIAISLATIFLIVSVF